MKRIFAFASAGALVVVLGIVGLFGASPASAQYTPVGGFTVTPSVAFPDTNVSVQGYCMVTSTVTVQYDGGPVIGTAVVPVPVPAPVGAPPWQSPPGHTPAWVITNQVTVPSHIPANATVGPHTLTVKCNGDFVQNLAITVINPTCNTGGRLSFDNLDGHEGVKPPGTPPPANPSITGTVTSSTSGLPLSYATVRVLRSNGTFVGGSYQTDVNGHYYWGALPNGQYKVQFVYLGFVTNTSPLFTYSGSLYTQNMALDPAATAPGIQGTVYDATTGQKLDGATVSLWQYPNLYQYVSVPTNNGGQYNFVGVPAGQYRLQFSAPHYQTLWYPSATNQADATVITLSVGSKPTIDAKILGTCAGGNANSYNNGIGNPPIPPGSTFANIAGPAGAVIVSGGAFLLMLNRRRIKMAPVLADGVAIGHVDQRPRRLHHFILHRFGQVYYADLGGRHGVPVPWKRVAALEAALRSKLGKGSWSVSKDTRHRTRQRLG
jgi:hypothetical protein